MTWLTAVQVISSILLIIAILLQQRGSNLGRTFGSDSTIFRTKRGIEKSLFRATIILALLFVGSTFAGLFI